ncbi:MAG TPA: hypothetical protein VGK22_09820 [Candidatus Angelobacter sp.]|jgi:hypothetical protein
MQSNSLVQISDQVRWDESELMSWIKDLLGVSKMIAKFAAVAVIYFSVIFSGIPACAQASATKTQPPEARSLVALSLEALSLEARSLENPALEIKSMQTSNTQATQPSPVPVYKVFAIRYASIPDFPVNAMIAGADPARKFNIAMTIWLIRGNGPILVNF